MTASVMIFAANPFESTEFLVAVGLLIVALLAGAVVIYMMDRWRKKRDRALAGTENLETLSMYREMQRRGEISMDEYKAIRTRIAGRIKAAANGSDASLEEFDDLKAVTEPGDTTEPKND